DRTGYPREMLGLDQDMEAELGIDSIKRVEILGALQKKLPETMVTSIKEQMESLTRIKTLNGMVDQLARVENGNVEKLASNGPSVASATRSEQPSKLSTLKPANSISQTPIVGAQDLTTLPDKTTLTHTLLRLVTERTGYPIEMLG